MPRFVLENFNKICIFWRIKNSSVKRFNTPNWHNKIYTSTERCSLYQRVHTCALITRTRAHVQLLAVRSATAILRVSLQPELTRFTIVSSVREKERKTWLLGVPREKERKKPRPSPIPSSTFYTVVSKGHYLQSSAFLGVATYVKTNMVFTLFSFTSVFHQNVRRNLFGLWRKLGLNFFRKCTWVYFWVFFSGWLRRRLRFIKKFSSNFYQTPRCKNQQLRWNRENKILVRQATRENQINSIPKRVCSQQLFVRSRRVIACLTRELHAST